MAGSAGSELGTSYFRLIPKMEGTADRIDKELSGVDADTAGNRIGQQLSDAIGESTDIQTSVGDQLSTLASGLGKTLAGLGIGAAIGKTLGDAIQTGIDQINLEGTLKAKLGDTTMASQAAQVAGQVYAAGWGDSLDQVGDSASLLMQQLGQIDDSADFTALTEQALALADTFDQDVGGMATAAGQMIKTGLADNAQEAFDILTVGFQSGADMGQDLLDTFTEYPAQFEKLGLSGEQAMGMISQGLQNGARNADLVADAIKEFSIRAVDGSETTIAGFEALGLSADDMAARFGQGGDVAAAAFDLVLDRLRGIEDPVARSAAAVNLFGTQAEDLGNALYSLDPSSAVDALGQVDGAAQQAASNAAGLEQSWESITRTLSQGLGTAVAPAVQGVANALTAAMPTIQAAVTGFTTTIGGFVQGVIGVIQSVIGAVDWTPLQTMLATLQTTFTTVGSALMPVLAQIGTLLGTVIGSALNLIVPLISAAASAIGTLVSAVLPPLSAILQAIIPVITSVVTTVSNAVMPVIQSLTGVIQGVTQVLQGVIDFLVGVFTGNWDQAWNGIKTIGEGVWNAIKNVVETAINAVKGVVESVLNTIRTVWESIWNAVKSFFSDTWDNVKSVASGAIDAVKGFIDNGTNAIKSTWEGIWNGVKSFFSDTWNGIKNAASDAIGFLGDKIGSIRDTVMNAVSGADQWLLDTGSNIISGLWNGISGAIGGLYNNIKNALSGLVDAAKNALGIGSPSKVFRDEVGAWILPGVQKGVDTGIRPLERAIDGALEQAVPDHRTISFGATTRGTAQNTSGTAETDDRLVDALTTALSRLPLVITYTDKRQAAIALAPAINERLGAIRRMGL